MNCGWRTANCRFDRASLRVAVIVLGLCFMWHAIAADFPPDWKFVQTLPISQTGLVKVSVPLDSLTAARPGLEDLRLYDNAGREIPYLIERPAQAEPVTRGAKKIQVTVNAASTVVTIDTGFTQPISGLTLQTPARDFLKAVQIEGSSNPSAWQTLDRGQLCFYQPGGANKLHLSLPSGVWPFLRLTLDDRRSAPIPITGAQVHAESGLPAPAEPVEATIIGRSEEPGQTRLTLRLAGANFTLAGLNVATPEALFTRPVALSQSAYIENEIRESILARSSIYRVAVEGQPTVSNLTFAVDTPVHTRELVVTVQNDDNPPLQITGVTARRRPVYLTFLATPSGPYHLLSGNTQCPAPRYELTSLKADLAGATPRPLAPGPLTANTAYRPTDPLAAVQALGTALDISDWKFRRRVQLKQDGVQQLELDLATMAEVNGSLSDLRIVREGKQIPYILERTSQSRSFTPTVNRADDPRRPAVSRWQVALPHRALPITRLTCATTAPYFKREMRLLEERRDERGETYTVSLASVVWVRTLGQKPAPIALPMGGAPQTDKLILEIDNGDNPPLELEKFEAWYPVTRVLFKSAPDADTFFYYGNPEAHTPQYDLELIVPRLLAAEKIIVALGAPESLRPGARSGGIAGAAGWAFWAVLAAVVAALLVILARLLPKPRV